MQTSYPSDASFNLVDYNKSISDISSSNHSLHSVIGRFLATDEAPGGGNGQLQPRSQNNTARIHDVHGILNKKRPESMLHIGRFGKLP